MDGAWAVRMTRGWHVGCEDKTWMKLDCEDGTWMELTYDYTQGWPVF